MKIFKIGKAIVIGAIVSIASNSAMAETRFEAARCGGRSGRGPSCQRNGGPRRRGWRRTVQETGVPSRCRRTSFARLPTRDLCQGMPEGAVAFSICHQDMYWTVEAERWPLFRAVCVHLRLDVRRRGADWADRGATAQHVLRRSALAGGVRI
jgi:hypothetical protein